MNLKKFWNLSFFCFLMSCSGVLIAHNIPATSVTTFHRICGKSNALSPGSQGLCPSESIPATLNSCRDGYVTISTYTTNLVKKPIKGQTYSWPVAYPDLHLSWEYSSGVTLTTPKLVDWVYVGVHYSGNQLFECQTDFIPQHLENFDCPTAVHTFQMHVDIVTPGSLPNSYDPYPILNYGYSGDIFSCEVFEETCALCNPPGTGGACNFTMAPSYDLEICIDCQSNGCGQDAQPAGNDKNPISQWTQANTQMEVLPNPFTSRVNFNYTTTLESRINVTIYNANGQAILVDEKNAEIGNNSFELNTDRLVNGVYYLEVSDGINTNVQRIVKIQ